MKLKEIFVGILLIGLTSFTYASCSTQTIVVNGKISVCTTCGKVTTCT